jgi:hypothetical protein
MIGQLKSITAIERENAVKIQRHQPEGMNVRMSGAAIILHLVSVAVQGKIVYIAGPASRPFFFTVSATYSLCRLQPHVMKAARWQHYQHSDMN